MARNTIPKGKLVRRFGENIFGNPKYDKLLRKKPHGPGKSSTFKKKKKISDYGRGLTEKQKFKFMYGLTESQLRKTYKESVRLKGDIGFNLMILCERRLDNVLYKANLAATTSQGKQLISHGHIKVNGKKISVASYLVNIEDVITIKDKGSSINLVKSYIDLNQSRLDPEWAEVDKEKPSLKILRFPEKHEVGFIGNEQLIVEYYSR